MLRGNERGEEKKEEYKSVITIIISPLNQFCIIFGAVVAVASATEANVYVLIEIIM